GRVGEAYPLDIRALGLRRARHGVLARSAAREADRVREIIQRLRSALGPQYDSLAAGSEAEDHPRLRADRGTRARRTSSINRRAAPARRPRDPGPAARYREGGFWRRGQTATRQAHRRRPSVNP